MAIDIFPAEISPALCTGALNAGDHGSLRHVPVPSRAGPLDKAGLPCVFCAVSTQTFIIRDHFDA
jgi:hypothetical protein